MSQGHEKSSFFSSSSSSSSSSSHHKEKADDSKDFVTYLKEAQDTDLTEIERTGCVRQGCDFKGNHLIVMIPALGLNKQEKPETMFRKMLLLFLLKTHELVGNAYSVVYAHTSIDIINQYPLIYKFYSILPRSYKKNLQKMYVIHPNVGIRMFFEFARVFLSHKFYHKLCLLEQIIDFQRIIPPTQLFLPLKFIRKEDEDRELKYCGFMAPLSNSFDPVLGTVSMMDICMTFLRNKGGLTMSGLFRVPGDENELNLAKIRLQYAYADVVLSTGDEADGGSSSSTSTAEAAASKSSGGGNASHHHPSHVLPPLNTTSSNSSRSRMVLSENGNYIILGDLNLLYAPPPSTTHAKDGKESSSATNSIDMKNSTHKSSGSSSNEKASSSSPTSSSSSATNTLAPEASMSIVVIQNVHSVAQIFKMLIRDLPEALIPTSVYNDLVLITRQFELSKLNEKWEITVGRRLSLMPFEHMSTLVSIISFLREVASHSDQNQMDSNNLATVFAPTVFRPEMTDILKAAMEVKLTQVILLELIKRPRILYLSILLWKEDYEKVHFAGASTTVVVPTNQVMTKHFEEVKRQGYATAADVYAASSAPAPVASEAELKDFISSNVTNAMLERCVRRSNRRTSDASEEASVEEDEIVSREQSDGMEQALNQLSLEDNNNDDEMPRESEFFAPTNVNMDA